MDKTSLGLIKIAGLEVTIQGRSNAPDYWDGNWLNVAARCDAPGAHATAEGSILHIPEIAAWLEALKRMAATLTGNANLEPMEPNLLIKMAANHLGQITLSVHITPDHLNQEHRFDFDIDQTYLPPLIASLEAVLKEFPVRGKPED